MSKHTVLFVDDDPLILKGLRRSLDEYDDHWNVEFALSGNEALSKLAITTFDAVVTDLLMPLMSGLALLEKVQETHPGVLRFVLSGNTSDFHAIQSVNLVHQMFPKPCDMELIYQCVERACRLKDTLSEPGLISIITSIHNLPSKPALYDQLIDELQTSEPNMKSVGDIISQDAAMTAKVLQLVNSAFFGLSEKISNPQRAVSLIGLTTTKALVLTSHVFSEYENRSNVPVSIQNLWNHSMLVSNITRQIAMDLSLSKQEQENAQVAGLLHDIGKLLEYKIPKMASMMRFQTKRVLISTEYEILNTSHAEMGAYLLGIWGLPTQIVEAILYHHAPAKQLAKGCTIITALHIANGLINMCMFDEKNIYDSNLDMKYLSRVIELPLLDGWTVYIKGMMHK
jgi:putative nucleotidyltransferase with HDIG domain